MSRIILEEETLNSIIGFALKNSPIKSFVVRGSADNTLYFKIIDIELENWLLDKLSDNTEMELKFKVKDNVLNVSIDLYGAMLTIAQNIPLLDNILIFFCPSMKNINGLKIISLSEIEIDLNVLLKDVRLNSINIYKIPERTLYIDFQLIKENDDV